MPPRANLVTALSQLQNLPGMVSNRNMGQNSTLSQMLASQNAVKIPPYSSIPGMHTPGNINILDRPIVTNPDGSSSTVRSMSIGTDAGEVLIPTVSNGADGLPPRVMSDKDAIDYYHNTGEHLGIFDTPENATAYAQALHLQQAQLGANNGRTVPQ